MATEQEAIRERLRRKLTLETKRLDWYDEYFEGEQPLKFVTPLLADELDERMMSVVIEFPRAAVFAYDDRLDVQGFRYPGQDAADATLWEIWQANDGELLSQQIQQEALALGRAYAIVGVGETDDVPLITAESPFDCMHEIDPRSREIANGIKQWTDLDGDRWVTLYQPNGRITWRKPKKSRDWIEDESIETGFDLPQMVAYPNQPRTLGRERTRRSKFDQRIGRSEFHGILSLADASNKMATDMMATSEHHAAPRRYAFGLSEKDFIDEDGNEVSPWRRRFGDMWASESPAKDVLVGQFAASDLGNFRESIKMLDQLIVQQLALPPHYSSFAGDNPASADAIRSAESQLVKRSERKQVQFGNRHERVQRLVLLLRGEKALSDDAKRIETIWRDAATPTKAQAADATVKLVAAKDGRGRSILPIEQAREDLGYTSEQRARMKDMDDAEDPTIAAATRELRLLNGDSGDSIQ